MIKNINFGQLRFPLVSKYLPDMVNITFSLLRFAVTTPDKSPVSVNATNSLNLLSFMYR